MVVSRRSVFDGLIAIAFLQLFTACTQTPIDKVQIEDGFLNLEDTKFKDGICQLGGTMNFYWDTLITADSAGYSKQGKLISINQSWNNQFNFETHPVFGYASYSFKVRLPDTLVGEQLILRPNHFIAYSAQVFVNNKLVANNGSVGQSNTDSFYKPSRRTSSIPFQVETPELNVVIWAANYSHFRGGIFNNLSLGLAGNMIEQREKAIAVDLLIIVSLLIMFLYHFLQYIVNTRNRITLFFSITCLIYAFDFSLQDTMSFFQYFPRANFQFVSLFHISLPYLIPSSYIFFLHALFPDEVSKKFRNVTGIITVVLIGITLTTDPVLYSKLVKPHFMYVSILVVYVYVVAIQAVKNKREGSKLFLIAYVIFSVCAINDILYVFDVINTPSLVSSGLMIFVFLLSILQGRLMANMRQRNIKLAINLQELNVGLEQKVLERTEALSISNSKLEQLSRFKEDMTKMIVHDLKSPIGAIINADLIQDKLLSHNLIKQSGYTMLNMVQNMLDVYRHDNLKLEIHNERVLISDIIEKALIEVRLSADIRSIKIKVLDDKDYIANVDKELIRRVIVNVFSNAIKHSSENSEITLLTSLSGNTLKISICNKGVSIPKDKQAYIFEKFSRLETEGHSVHSSGLGLAFCKMAVEAHGGEIGVVSEDKAEVEFWFAIPNVQAHSDINVDKTDLNEFELPLLQKEKEYLKPFVKQLVTCQVYEVSVINNIVHEIDTSNANIKKWTEQLINQVYLGNEDGFVKYLSMVE